MWPIYIMSQNQFEFYVEEDSLDDKIDETSCHERILDSVTGKNPLKESNNEDEHRISSPKYVIDAEESFTSPSAKFKSVGSLNTNHLSQCRLLRSSKQKTKMLLSSSPTFEYSSFNTSSYVVQCWEENCESKFRSVRELRNHLMCFHNFPPFDEEKLQFHSLQAAVRCTSQIIVKAMKGGKECLDVSFFERHYGHDYVELLSLKEKTSEKRHEDEMIECQLCYKKVHRLDKHIRNVHEKGTIPESPSGPIECLEPNCGKKFRLRRFLREHLIRYHNLEMHTGNVLRFASLEEFEDWKSKLEEETQSFYKKRQIDTNKTYKCTIQFVCIRAGKTYNTSHRSRNHKLHGSRRSNIHCTSEIKLRYLDDGTYEVAYFKDHYGHDNSLVHLPVPKKVKEEILEKLKAGQGVTSIVRELRMSPGNHLTRKHLIRRKDVLNIKAAHAIKTPEGVGKITTNDIGSVDAWVNLTLAKFDGVIRFYKAEDCVFEDLDKSDFVVVCMTPFQKEMAVKFGGDRVCVDSTADMSTFQQACELTTILVVNEFEEGIPVAFCFSSKVNVSVLGVFFTVVRDVVGSIQCETFVATPDPRLYTSWCEVMGAAPCHVLSAWHVDASWRFALDRIANDDQRSHIYERLKACRLQCDINQFVEMFQSLLNDLEMNDDHFTIFLKKYFAFRPEIWAVAHRIGTKFNTNLHIENYHRIIRRNFIMGKEKNKIEKCISVINSYLLDREYDQLMDFCKKKVLTKLASFSSQHEAGETLLSGVVEIVESSCWAVSSCLLDVIYIVNRVESHNCSATCAIVCQNCSACLKGYNCSCDDNAINGDLCEHLHAVAEYQRSHGSRIIDVEERVFHDSMVEDRIEPNGVQLLVVGHEDREETTADDQTHLVEIFDGKEPNNGQQLVVLENNKSREEIIAEDQTVEMVDDMDNEEDSNDEGVQLLVVQGNEDHENAISADHVEELREEKGDQLVLVEDDASLNEEFQIDAKDLPSTAVLSKDKKSIKKSCQSGVIFDAMRLMNELKELREILPRSVENKIRRHISEARKLIHDSRKNSSQ